VAQAVVLDENAMAADTTLLFPDCSLDGQQFTHAPGPLAPENLKSLFMLVFSLPNGGLDATTEDGRRFDGLPMTVGTGGDAIVQPRRTRGRFHGGLALGQDF